MPDTTKTPTIPPGAMLTPRQQAERIHRILEAVDLMERAYAILTSQTGVAEASHALHEATVMARNVATTSLYTSARTPTPTPGSR